MTRSPISAAFGSLLALASLATAHEAHAQVFDSAVRIDQLQPASPGSPFLRTEGPRDRFDAGVAFAARVLGEGMLDPLRARVVSTTGSEEAVSLVKYAALVHAGGQFSPVHWLNLELDVPFAVFEKGDSIDGVLGQARAAGSPGLGDIRVGAHVLPINGRRFDLQLGGRFWVPSGSENAYLQSSNRLVRVEAVVAAAGETERLAYGCTLGLAPMWFAGRDGDRLAASCAVGVRLGDVVRLAVEPHVAAFTFRSDKQQPTLPGLGDAAITLAFEPMASLSFQLGSFLLGIAGGAGLGDAPGTASARGLLSLTYASKAARIVDAPGEEDQDLDGVSDAYDACPKEAGPEERRGCPEKRDQDGDGIVEGDACPDQPGASYPDPKANGCPDRDNDHVADPVDACPTEPGDPPGGCPKYARLEGKAFKVTPALAFAAGASELAEKQAAALVEIVRTIRANPNVGHFAVKLGAKDAAAKLTDARAAAILALLNEQNLESNRYELVLEDALAGGALEVTVVK